MTSRVIYDEDALRHPGILEHVQRMTELGEHARVVTRLPLKLALFDRRTALVPTHMDAEGGTGQDLDELGGAELGGSGAEQSHQLWHVETGLAQLLLAGADECLDDDVGGSGLEPCWRAAPPGDQRLAFEIEVERPPVWWANPTRTITEYEFRSQPTGEASTVLPLLRLAYDLDLDLGNRAPAPRLFTFDVKVDHQPGAVTAPIDRLEADVSFDDGQTWQPMHRVKKVANGQYRVTVTHPSPGDTSGYASCGYAPGTLPATASPKKPSAPTGSPPAEPRIAVAVPGAWVGIDAFIVTP